MAQIRVEVRREVAGTPDQVLAALGDYQGARARAWPDNIHDYRVVAGGTGPGSRIAYRLQATRKRARDIDALVSAPEPGTLVEADQNSSLRTSYRITPAGGGARSAVTATTTWDGARGVGGFFERTFAPIGIRKLHTAVLDRITAPVS
ncbi:Polyketide cyclase / dehydrase and lipid transport [Frankia sp. AiPs1]|uniref:SRPBCC family protein n=1 Tax=Frankia sp. AiPa1 TaxID=573492 RepID=UPI00202B4773|nr:SRPBCC family protein [Frankia sp. AiPa1]MCL9762898.1 SRPBCC family protein [Frankia sp. AiPa1]